MIRNLIMTAAAQTTTSSSNDANFSNVSLLLNGEGSLTDKSTTGTPVTVNSAQISTGVKKYGTGSMYFNGSSYLTTSYLPVNFRTNDFTAELWVNFNSFPSFQRLIALGNVNAGGGFAIEIPYSSAITVHINGSYPASSIGFSFGTGVWYHIAVTRSSGTVRIYVNGSLKNSYTNSGDVNLTNNFYIGCNDGGGNASNCYIDDLRITKGVARYTGPSFTPPTSQLPTS